MALTISSMRTPAKGQTDIKCGSVLHMQLGKFIGFATQSDNRGRNQIVQQNSYGEYLMPRLLSFVRKISSIMHDMGAVHDQSYQEDTADPEMQYR